MLPPIDSQANKINISYQPVDIKALQSQMSSDALLKGLRDALNAFSKAAGGITDPSMLKFKLDESVELTPNEFISYVVKNNKASVIPAIKSLCKNTKYLETIIPAVGDNNKKISKGETKYIQPITVDLSEPKLTKNTNIAVGQGQVSAQDITNPNNRVSEKGNALTVDEKENGVKLVYSEKWLVKVLMENLGYKKVV